MHKNTWQIRACLYGTFCKENGHRTMSLHDHEWRARRPQPAPRAGLERPLAAAPLAAGTGNGRKDAFLCEKFLSPGYVTTSQRVRRRRNVLQYVQRALITKGTNLDHKDQDSSTPSAQRDNSTGLWEANNWHRVGMQETWLSPPPTHKRGF